MVRNGQKQWIGVVGRMASIQWVAPMSYFIEKSESYVRNRSEGEKNRNLTWNELRYK